VRSTAYSRVALIITLAAALALVLVWARRFLHDGRSDPTSADEPSRGTPAPEPTPPPGSPDIAEVRPEDSTSAFVRKHRRHGGGDEPVPAHRLPARAAMAFALGITETRLADAYTIANTTPNIIYELAIGGVLSSVLVPVFVEWMQKQGRTAAWEVARKLFTLAVLSHPPSR